MLDRAAERVGAATHGTITTLQSDVRAVAFANDSFDLILAASVLHHLRADAEWETVFASFHRWLRPGGSLWIFDLVTHEVPAVQDVMWRRYGEYLVGLKDDSYRETVFQYVEEEDSPRPVTYQLDLLRRAGFRATDVLHKNGPFAAFGAIK
jgi:tRNA (cmo5U34)-methyltransferase